MSRRRTRIFVLAGVMVFASLGLVGGLRSPVACGIDGRDYACTSLVDVLGIWVSRVDVLGILVSRPVAVVSLIVIGALLGAAFGFALSRVSNRTYLATGLGVVLGSALFAMSRVLPW
jgi:hypothetical protein